MLNKIPIFAVVVLLALSTTSCPCPEPVGGLEEEDFRLISLNGFDPEDNDADLNDYAWSMEYFAADGKGEGHVYVATGNDMIGLIYQGIQAIMLGGELGEIEAHPPEIRRYRSDLGETEWERVFDYRDIEPDGEFETIGFRFLKSYNALSSGVTYLYAATFGREATVWRSATGDPGSWTSVWTSGAIGSVRWMEEHNRVLYLALSNDTPEGERLGKIWATDGDTFWPVMEDAFGNPNNTGVMSLASFNGWLVAGTQNDAEGYEIWKLEGPSEKNGPVPLVLNGGPSSANQSAITPYVFQGKLYYGNMINPYANLAGGLKAADIIRIHPDDTWETLVGPGSITGWDSGFDHWPNTYIWWMEQHDGWLYASTYDQVSAFSNVLENLDLVFEALFGSEKREANPVEEWANAGSDLYKTQDGINWYPVTLTGFGDVGNYGFRIMKSVGDRLYVGTANPFDGLEVWVGGS
jgi:hypothetical protein